MRLATPRPTAFSLWSPGLLGAKKRCAARLFGRAPARLGIVSGHACDMQEPLRDDDVRVVRNVRRSVFKDHERHL